MISNRISKHNILFLQHGVTALKRVHPIFGMKGSSPMTHFTTTSRFEHKIIVENFGYEDGDAPILGFTRWDVHVLMLSPHAIKTRYYVLKYD